MDPCMYASRESVSQLGRRNERAVGSEEICQKYTKREEEKLTGAVCDMYVGV